MDLHEDLEVPTIHELFVYYDHLYFDSSLGTCTVEWSPQRMTRCAGICYPQAGGGCILRLSEPLLRLRPSWELKNTLIHEMIHAWLITRGIREDNGGHGPRFQAKAHEINVSTKPDFQKPARGYNITIYHTMHDEVRFYQQHHWQCSVCGKLICRSMNRKPQQADCRNFHRFRGEDCKDKYCGYHSHLRNCPRGEFIKVKTPEGYSDKKQKKRQADGGEAGAPLKRPRNHPDKTRSITEFFKGPGRVASEGETAEGAAPSSADSGGQGRDELRRRTADAASKRAQQSEPSRTAADPLQQGARSPGSKKPASKQQADLHSFLKAPTTTKEGPSGECPRGKGDRDSTGPSCSAVLQVNRVDRAEKLKDLWDHEEGEGGSSRQSSGNGGGADGGSSSRVPQLLARQNFMHETKCPVCGKVLFAVSNSDLNAHVDRCLVQQGSPDDVVVLD